MTSGAVRPRRNWGGVVIAITGAALVVAAVLQGVSRSIVNFPTEFYGPIFGIQVGLVALSPIALIVGFAPISFGGRRLFALAGTGLRGRLWVFAAPVVAMIADYTIVGLLLSGVGQSNELADERAQNASIVVGVFALLVGLVAAIVIVQVRAVRGLARWSMIIAVALVSVTVAGADVSADSEWTSLPYAVGILVLGLSWWRAGISSSLPVTETTKSLAE